MKRRDFGGSETASHCIYAAMKAVEPLVLSRSAYDAPLIAGDAWAPSLSEADRVRSEVQTAH